MKIYTKEWYRAVNQPELADLMKPVEDKSYTDAEIEALYQRELKLEIQEELEAYNEPPFFPIEIEDIDPEDFDPEEFLVGDPDDEDSLHYPESYEELVAYMELEKKAAWEEFRNRPPFDEGEIREDFEERYRDNLEEPDEDLPDWVLDAVDPRLLALYLLPEPIYRRLKEHDQKIEEEFDRADERATALLEELEDSIPEELDELLSEFEGDYVAALRRNDGDLELVLLGWDDDERPCENRIIFEAAEILEDEGLSITVTRDEDGDLVSDCDLSAQEVYSAEDGYEVHLLFDNEELKYVTLRCQGLWAEQELLA